MSDRVKKQVRALLKLPENRVCADCPIKGPTWASINLGVFLCLECAGIHRNLGVHISKVRSTQLDTWQQPWLDVMKSKGNSKANAFWEARCPSDFSGRPTQSEAEALSRKLKRFITDKYEKKLWVASAKERASSVERKEAVQESSSSSDTSDSSSSEDEEERMRREKERKLAKKKRKQQKKALKEKSKEFSGGSTYAPEPELDLFGSDSNSVTSNVPQVATASETLHLGNYHSQSSPPGTMSAPSAVSQPSSSKGTIDLASLYSQTNIAKPQVSASFPMQPLQQQQSGPSFNPFAGQPVSPAFDPFSSLNSSSQPIAPVAVPHQAQNFHGQQPALPNPRMQQQQHHLHLQQQQQQQQQNQAFDPFASIMS